MKINRLLSDVEGVCDLCLGKISVVEYYSSVLIEQTNQQPKTLTLHEVCSEICFYMVGNELQFRPLIDVVKLLTDKHKIPKDLVDQVLALYT